MCLKFFFNLTLSGGMYVIIGNEEAEEEGLLTIAKLMLVSARTAPKGMGRDSIVTAILTGEEKDKLTEELLRKRPRDGWSLQQSSVVVLIGVKIPEDTPERRQNIKLMDLGIAIGSAAKTAMIHNADNRIMASAGNIAKAMGFLDADHVLAIPLAATGKNAFWDRTGVYQRLDDGYVYEDLEKYKKL